MQVSALLLQQRPWPELRTAAGRWDESGARALYVADHLRGTPAAEQATWFDAFALLGALAATTSRIRLGTMVASVTLRDPVLLALAAHSIDQLSQGRFELGVGAGGRPSDATMRGYDAPSGAGSFAALTDAVHVLHSLLSGETITHRGAAFSTRNAKVVDAPVQRPRLPLTLAAHGPRGIDLAAWRCETWTVAGDRQGDRASQLAKLRRLSQLLDERLEFFGRSPTSIRRSVLVGIYPGMTFTTLDELLELADELATIGFQELIVYDPPFALDGGPVAPPQVVGELLESLDRFRAL